MQACHPKVCAESDEGQVREEGQEGINTLEDDSLIHHREDYGECREDGDAQTQSCERAGGEKGRSDIVEVGVERLRLLGRHGTGMT